MRFGSIFSFKKKVSDLEAQTSAIKTLNSMIARWGCRDFFVFLEDGRGLSIDGLGGDAPSVVVSWSYDGETILEMSANLPTSPNGDFSWDKFTWKDGAKRTMKRIEKLYFRGEFYSQDDEMYASC